MINTTSAEILQTLRSLGYKVDFQDNTDQIYYLIDCDGKQIPIFIKSISDGQIIQAVAFFPFKSNPAANNDLGRFLHILNKDIDMPGYCMDESSNSVFYRLCMPAFNKKISINDITTYLSTLEKVAKETMNTIAPIASGDIALKQLLDRLQ